MRRRFHVTLRADGQDEPLLYTVGQKFGVVTNIRRASIEEGAAWIVLELRGDEPAIGEAVSFLAAQGARVDRIDDDEDAG